MFDFIIIQIDPDGNPIAFILNALANDGCVLSYQHIGQHSEASIEYMTLECTSPKTPDEIIKAYELVQELKSIGYEMEGV